MEKKLIIAGSGGQGILFFGKILAFASMIEGKEVTWFPSYGAEIRGGTANCTVIISDSMIGSPVVLTSDILVAMNEASLVKYLPRLRRGGLLFYDSSLIGEFKAKGVNAFPVPATETAVSSGNTKSANMVMLGALIACTGLLGRSSIIEVLDRSSKAGGKNGVRLNINSILRGMKYIEDKKG